MAAFPAPIIWSFPNSNSVARDREASIQVSFCDSLGENITKTSSVYCGGVDVSLLTFLNSHCELLLLPTRSDESKEYEGLFGDLKSLFDPNEITKTGKVLPKAYLKSVKEVVKTLHESLKEDTNDMATFRQTDDAANESIREYFNGWRVQKTVADETLVPQKSYAMFEKSIRSLVGFYSKAGSSAALPEEVKSELLSDLTTAEESL